MSYSNTQCTIIRIIMHKKKERKHNGNNHLRTERKYILDYNIK